jgi:murein DD-endopeptidase MepM/ murein hydrolase activator NlpD
MHRAVIEHRPMSPGWRTVVGMRFRLLAAAASLLAIWGSSAAAALDAPQWQWPLAGHPTVTRGFDPPSQDWLPGHRGVDLRAHAGDRVRAAGGGVIGYAGRLAGRGVITVHHPGGLETTYEPVTATVRAGEHVVGGQRIGRVTSGHGNCGVGFVCLHWGLRRDTTYLDPLRLVRPTEVRLLPIFSRVGEAPAGLGAPSAPPTRTARGPASSAPARRAAAPATAAVALATIGGLIAVRRMGRSGVP